jgi:hypothetical protein
MQTIEVGPFEFHDKIPLKNGYAEKGVRVVPHALARYGAFIERRYPDAILCKYRSMGWQRDYG